jgi:hypothetical protein
MRCRGTFDEMLTQNFNTCKNGFSLQTGITG